MRHSVDSTGKSKTSNKIAQVRRTGQTTQPRHPKKFLSLRVAAYRAGLSLTTMYQWAKRGKTSSGAPIEVVKDDLRNQLLISEEALAALLTNRYTPLRPE